MHATQSKTADRKTPPAGPSAAAPRPLARDSRQPAWLAATAGVPAALFGPSLPLQAKLTISTPGDAAEQEADRVAAQVMRMPDPAVAPGLRRCACGGIAGPDGECAACRAKRLGLQRRATTAIAPTVAPPLVHTVLQTPGRPLDSATRAFMEPRFGQDFSAVRVHTDTQAARSARAVAARAYTVGQHIVFGAGHYAPGTGDGQQLLAHELAHVVQQGGGSPVPPPLGVSHPRGAAGQEAAGAARTVLRGGVAGAQGLLLSRQPLGLMRDFDSTMRICRALLKSRTFHVDNGVVTVTLQGHWEPAEEVEPDNPGPECPTMPYYYVTLVREGTIFDSDISTHPVPFGSRSVRTWTGLASGDYHLTIWTNNTNPYCCLVGDVSVATPAGGGTAGAGVAAGGTVPSLPATACYDGDVLYVSKNGQSYSCPALTGTVGDPTPPGQYCIRRQGEAQVAGGLRGRILQDRSSWFLLEPQFTTTRYRMQLHPGTMSSGCITVMDRACFDRIAAILNSGATTRATGYDGYPPGNTSGTVNEAHDVDCVGILTVTSTPGSCAGRPAGTPGGGAER